MQSCNGMLLRPPCTANDYVTAIYADKTRLPNAFQYSCAFATNGTLVRQGYCCSLTKENIVAKNQYFYEEPESYAAYLKSLQPTSNGTDGIAVDKILHGAQQCGRVDQSLTCGIEPACGGGSVRPDLFYNPNTAMEPVRQVPGRQFAATTPFRPATSFPILDRFDWAPVNEQPYCFATETEAAEAVRGIRDGVINRRDKFNRTSFQEQVDVWNRLIGVNEADLSTQVPECKGKSLVTCCPKLTRCESTPIPYYFNYTDFK